MEPKITLNLGLTTLYQAVQTTLHKPKLSIVYHSLVNYEVDFLIGLVCKLLFFLFSHHQLVWYSCISLWQQVNFLVSVRMFLFGTNQKLVLHPGWPDKVISNYTLQCTELCRKKGLFC